MDINIQQQQNSPALNMGGGMTPLSQGIIPPNMMNYPYNSVATTPMEVSTPGANMVGQMPLLPTPASQEMRDRFKSEIDKLNELLNHCLPPDDARSFLQAGLPVTPIYPKHQMHITTFEMEISEFFQKLLNSESVPVLLYAYLESVKKQSGQMRVLYSLYYLRLHFGFK